MKTTYKYIEFNLVECKPKTKVYAVRNINNQLILGYIEWYTAWRQYCFLTQNGMVFSKDCLEDICGFIKQLMDERKK
jgi:hypothetical protein